MASIVSPTSSMRAHSLSCTCSLMTTVMVSVESLILKITFAVTMRMPTMEVIVPRMRTGLSGATLSSLIFKVTGAVGSGGATREAGGGVCGFAGGGALVG